MAIGTDPPIAQNGLIEHPQHELALIDLTGPSVVDVARVRQSWFGLAADRAQGRVWWSGGGANVLHTYDVKNGKLTRTETVDARDPSKFDKIDSDRDGALTYGEVAAFSDNDFGAMDANGDGAIDREEAQRAK